MSKLSNDIQIFHFKSFLHVSWAQSQMQRLHWFYPICLFFGLFFLPHPCPKVSALSGFALKGTSHFSTTENTTMEWCK